MRISVTDSSGRKLALTDVTGTAWRATYMGFFNLDLILLACVCPGYPAFMEITDGAQITTLTRVPWTEASSDDVGYLRIGDVVSIQPGKFSWTMKQSALA